MQNASRLKNEIAFFHRHQQEYIKDHYGKYVLIYQDSAHGFYDTGGGAYRVAKQGRFKSGAFLIRQCLRPDEEKKVVFHSRVL